MAVYGDARGIVSSGHHFGLQAAPSGIESQEVKKKGWSKYELANEGCQYF